MIYKENLDKNNNPINGVKATIFKAAFTLAEVLIVLGIIGIIAEMTIPTLFANYQKQVYVTRLKKTYSQFNQALQLMTHDYGCDGDLKCTGLMSASTTNKSFGDEIVKYFKIAKNCDVGNDNDCYSSKVRSWLNGLDAGENYNSYGFYRFIILDGASIALSNYKYNCTAVEGTNNLSNTCGTAYIDVNGPEKGPNIYGKDLYAFRITNGKGAILYPLQGRNDTYSGYWKDQGACDPTQPEYTHQNGVACGAKIMEEGWQINY